MSWEKPLGRNAISRYYAVKSGSTTDATSAIAAYLIDVLEDKAPTIQDKFGSTSIYYHWFHGADPSESMQSPAVGISVMSGERETLGINVNTNEDILLFGGLMQSEITVVIIGDSPRQREAISNKVFQVLNKWVHVDSNPIHYIRKGGYGDDRGFSSIDRFVMSSLWQNYTEDKYLKIDAYTIGYVEFYTEDEDVLDWAVIGEMLGEGIPDFYAGHTTVRVSFTTNLV